jgi:DNA repair exonuclease SbcCD ATPase subunit
MNQHKLRMEFELGELQGQVAGQEALLKNIDSTEPPAEEVEMLLHADPMAQMLLQELAVRKVRQLLAEDGNARKIRRPQPRANALAPDAGPLQPLPPVLSPQPEDRAEPAAFGPIVPPSGLLVPSPAAPSTPVPPGALPGLPDEPVPSAPRKKASPGSSARPSRTRVLRPPTSPAEDVETPSAAHDGDGRAPASDKARIAERVQREINILQEALDEKLAEARKKVQERRRMLVLSEATKLQYQCEVKRELYEKLAKDVERLRQEAQKFGSTTVDIEMLNADLKQMDVMAAQLNAEKEKIKVELQSAPRITVVEKAEDPLEPSNSLTRWAVTILTMLMVFFGAAIIVILFDALTRVRVAPNEAS